MLKRTRSINSGGSGQRPVCASAERKTVLRILLSAFAVLLLFSLAALPASAAPSGNWADYVGDYTFTDDNITVSGDGTFTIKTDYGLAWVAWDINSHSANRTGNFVIDRDIDLGEHYWTPIGTYTDDYVNSPFDGDLDGKNKTISNLSISSSSDYQGLFGYTTFYMSIQNLRLMDVNVTGNKKVGGFAGYTSGMIENCYAIGNVTGNTQVGGLVGNSYSGLIKNSSAIGNVTGNNLVGGLVGNNDGRINYCYTIGNVTGNSQVGGLVGGNGGGIENSVALNPSVSSVDAKLGRVAGSSMGGEIITCYAWEGMKVNNELVSSGGLNGTNASSSDVWANISLYSDSNKLNWQGISYADAGDATTWKITRNSADGWAIPYLRSFGVPLDSSSIQHLKPFVITFDSMGGSPVDAQNITKGFKAVEPTAPTKAGNTFEGWYPTSAVTGSKYDFNTPVTEDKTLYANWTQQMYNVTFNNNTGIGTMADQRFASGVDQALHPNEFTKSGYTFEGWNETSADGKTIDYTNGQIIRISSDITLYAVWKKNPSPIPPSGGGTDTGSGHYTEYPRTVIDGGHVSFGTSPTVTGVDLPKGVSGSVILVVKSETPAPDGKPTYTVFEITIPNYPEGEKAVIQFKISVAELEKAGYSAEDICLYHCGEDGAWTALPTTFTINGGIVYYEAVTTAFSPFAIVFEKGGAVEVIIPAVTETHLAEPEQTYVEPTVPEAVPTAEQTSTGSAIPTAQQTKSPLGFVGLGLGLLGAFAVLRRK